MLTACLAASPAIAEPSICYDPAQILQIAGAIRELDVCKQSLKAREQFIEVQKLGTPPVHTAWWQEPSVVVGGVVVSLSVGMVLGLFIAH